MSFRASQFISFDTGVVSVPPMVLNQSLPRRSAQSIEQMLSDIPTVCDIGGKKDSRGNTKYWRGYKLHLDVADGQIPISALLTWLTN